MFIYVFVVVICTTCALYTVTALCMNFHHWFIIQLIETTDTGSRKEDQVCKLIKYLFCHWPKFDQVYTQLNHYYYFFLY